MIALAQPGPASVGSEDGLSHKMLWFFQGRLRDLVVTDRLRGATPEPRGHPVITITAAPVAFLRNPADLGGPPGPNPGLSATSRGHRGPGRGEVQRPPPERFRRSSV
jgi:hypothetical protein